MQVRSGESILNITAPLLCLTQEPYTSTISTETSVLSKRIRNVPIIELFFVKPVKFLIDFVYTICKKKLLKKLLLGTYGNFMGVL